MFQDCVARTERKKKRALEGVARWWGGVCCSIEEVLPVMRAWENTESPPCIARLGVGEWVCITVCQRVVVSV